MINLPPQVQIKKAPNDAGSGLFATVAIDPGEEIFRIERPLVSVLDSPHLKDACANCHVWCPHGGVGQFGEEKGNDVKLKACLGCKIERYCSKECQAQAWKEHHRLECKIFKKLYPNVLPNTVRIVIQLLLRKQAKTISESEWQDFVDLQSHIDDFRSSQVRNEDNLTTWQTIELMSQAASTYSGSREPISLIQSLTARVLVNTLTLTTPTFDPLGLCLTPLSSLLNHNCVPNTIIIFSATTLTLRSLHPIPAETEFTISYIDTTNPTVIRQSSLQTRYFFTCTCAACKAHLTNNLPDPPYDTPFEAIKVRAIELQNDAATKTPDQATTLLKEALRILTPYPPHKQPYPTILHTAFLNAIATNAWSLALSYALRAYFHIDPVRYPLSWHPLRLVRKWVLLRCVVNVAGLVSEGDGSVEALGRFGVDWQVVGIGLGKEVESGVRLSHGESAFAEEVRRFLEGIGVEGRGVERGKVEGEWGRLRRVAGADL